MIMVTSESHQSPVSKPSVPERYCFSAASGNEIEACHKWLTDQGLTPGPIKHNNHSFAFHAMPSEIERLKADIDSPIGKGTLTVEAKQFCREH